MIDGQRDGHPFGDIVDGNRKGDHEAKGEIIKGGDKGGKPLREVVDANGDGGEDSRALERASDGVVALERGELFLALELVGVDIFGDELVNECRKSDPSKKAEQSKNLPQIPWVDERKGLHRLGENLHKGDINHHTSGET